MIKIICLGKLKTKYLEEFVNDYQKRISKYHKLEIIELKDEEDLENEARSILKHINPTDYIITLEIEGNNLSSLDFAQKLNDIFNHYSCLTFIIGSSLGLSNTIKKISNYALSFGYFTYPHGIFRGLLLEQIYRAFKINNNETYHK